LDMESHFFSSWQHMSRYFIASTSDLTVKHSS
jgi:hypothetical protein